MKGQRIIGHFLATSAIALALAACAGSDLPRTVDATTDEDARLEAQFQPFDVEPWEAPMAEPIAQPVSMTAAEEAPMPGPYTVYFDLDSADIGEDASQILEAAIQEIKDSEMAVLVVAGYADRSGSDEHNILLSENRAESVARYLADKGIERERMRVNFYGESQPALNTDDGAAEAGNRRVRITVFDSERTAQK